MSAYRTHASKVTCGEAIIEALVDRVVQRRRARMGEARFAKEQDEVVADARKLVAQAIETYEHPVNLVGYQGDTRTQEAHIIARASFVNHHLGGGASNDVGFLRADDGSYEAIVSDYDESAWWGSAAPRFWQAAMAHEAERNALAAGYQLHRTEVDGNIRLEAVMAGTAAGSSHGGAGW
jgi:hypothetical protein